MTDRDDVEREALRDWLDQRDALAADERPDPGECEDPPPPLVDEAWLLEIEPHLDPDVEDRGDFRPSKRDGDEEGGSDG